MEKEERLNESVPDSLIIEYLLKEKRELMVELGKEKAYIEELKDLLELEKNKSAEVRKLSKEALKDIRKEQCYQAMRVQIKSLEKSKKSLILYRDQLCYKVAEYEQTLRKYHLL